MSIIKMNIAEDLGEDYPGRENWPTYRVSGANVGPVAEMRAPNPQTACSHYLAFHGICSDVQERREGLARQTGTEPQYHPAPHEYLLSRDGMLSAEVV